MARPNTRSLTAAAVRVKVSDKKLAAKTLGADASWQEDAIAYCETVPELTQAQTYVGNQLAKLLLGVGWVKPGAQDPVWVTPDDMPDDMPADVRAAVPAAVAELGRLRGEFGGRPSIQMRMARNLDGPGEVFLVGWAAREETELGKGDGIPESWQACSIKEVAKKGGKFFVLDSPADKAGREITDADTIIRIWSQDSTWVGLADSAVKGVLGEAKILQVLSQQVLAQAMRAASNGFFTVPNELSDGGATPVEPEDGDEATADPLIAVMDQVMQGPLEDPSDPSSVQPAIFRGAAEFLKPDVLRHITFWDKAQDDALEAKIEARVKRIARGINLPVEVVMGLESTTFANAEQVDTDTFEDFLQPRCDLMVEGLTIGFLRPNLADAGVAADVALQLVVMYDASPLLSEPDEEKNADAAHDRFAISDAAYRRAKGFDESDAPDPVEVVVRAGLKRGIFTAELTGALIAAIADAAGVELPDLSPAAAADAQAEAQIAVADQTGDATGETAAMARTVYDQLASALLGQRARPTTPDARTLSRVVDTVSAAAHAPRVNYGSRLVQIDTALRTRLHVAADAAMSRALEKAGNRLRSKAAPERATLKNVAPCRVFATLGPTVAARFITTDEALDGAWADLESQFYAWGRKAQADALATASAAAGGFTDAQLSAYRAQQADDLDRSWAWMRTQLDVTAAAALFSPDASAAALGEIDATARVSVGLIRQAITRAGGSAGLTTNGNGGAWLALADGGTRPAGGIGTGELLLGAMRDHGVGVEGWEWTWGPGARSDFPPHKELDGVQFATFDDPVLTNTSGFPDVPFYMPGDHAGCVCDVTPIILPVEDTSLTSDVAVTDDADLGA